MNNDWVKVYSSGEIHKVEIVKAVLEDNGIAVFMINKKDSSYIIIGEIELFVKAGDEILAKVIINNNQL
ncbi:MAG: putative signal transducing protein [Bacteroidia bacterium]